MSDVTEGSDIVTYRTARWAEVTGDSEFTDSSESSCKSLVTKNFEIDK